MQQVTIEELLIIIGQKEAELYLLRKQIQKLQKELEKQQKESNG